MFSDSILSKNDAEISVADDGVKEDSAMDAFNEWFEALPAQNEAFEDMSDDEILSHRVDDYL